MTRGLSLSSHSPSGEQPCPYCSPGNVFLILQDYSQVLPSLHYVCFLTSPGRRDLFLVSTLSLLSPLPSLSFCSPSILGPSLPHAFRFLHDFPPSPTPYSIKLCSLRAKDQFLTWFYCPQGLRQHLVVVPQLVLWKGFMWRAWMKAERSRNSGQVNLRD